MTDILDFSISKRSNEGVRMVFRDPDTGVPVRVKGKGDRQAREMYLVLLGPGSNEFKRVAAQAANRNARKKPNHTPSDTEIEQNRISDATALARLVVGGELYSGGKWVTMTAENAGDFLYEVDPLRGQVADFVWTAGNFTNKAAA